MSTFFDDIFNHYTAPCADEVWSICRDIILEPSIANLIDDMIINNKVNTFMDLINILCERAIEILKGTLPDAMYDYMLNISQQILTLSNDFMETADPFWDLMKEEDIIFTFKDTADGICDSIVYEVDDTMTSAYLDVFRGVFYNYIKHYTDEDVQHITNEITSMKI